MYVEVTETQTGETALMRELTQTEETRELIPLEYAEEALTELDIDPQEATSHSTLAPIVVTFYRELDQVGGPVCWSSHGFYPKVEV